MGVCRNPSSAHYDPHQPRGGSPSQPRQLWRQFFKKRFKNGNRLGVVSKVLYRRYFAHTSKTTCIHSVVSDGKHDDMTETLHDNTTQRHSGSSKLLQETCKGFHQCKLATKVQSYVANCVFANCVLELSLVSMVSLDPTFRTQTHPVRWPRKQNDWLGRRINHLQLIEPCPDHPLMCSPKFYLAYHSVDQTLPL